jgi:hypothetical protein
MKKLITILMLMIIPFFVFGQDKKVQTFSYEFNVSINKTIIIANDAIGKFGFGAGVHIIARSDKKFNYVMGVVYNMTKKFEEEIYYSRWNYDTDVFSTMHYLSIPLKFRYNFGSNIIVFVELGLFFDIPLYCLAEGVSHTIYPLGGYEVSEYKSKRSDITSYFGIVGGVGIRIPVGRYQIVIKPDYKFGMNKSYFSQSSMSFNSYTRLNFGFVL